jgi:geranylgeranyl reductase family protein
MARIHDCIVLGAGPAGATAAYHLARAGRSVLLLEKARLPRVKPCGGGVSPEVGQWLPFDLAPAISAKVSRLRFTWKLGAPVEAELASPLWMVRRDVFDQLLVDQAVAQGVELRDAAEAEGCRFQADHWRVDTAWGPRAGRCLIAADGALGRTAKALGFTCLKHLPAVALEGEAHGTMTDTRTASLDFGSIAKGYQWAFPKADGWSLGTGVFRGGGAQNLRSAFERYCRAFGVDPTGLDAAAHPLKLWDGDQALHRPQALLAGEAACLVDPFTAEGVRPAILSGYLAAEAVHGALAGQDRALEGYTQAIQARWGTEMAWARRLAQAFYRLPAAAYRLGVARPGAAQRMGQILSGEVRYSDVAQHALAWLG